MAAGLCGDCGSAFVWSAEAASSVCPTCGTLQDPNQTVLAAQLDDPALSNVYSGFDTLAPVYRPQTHRPLKSLRREQGWDLAGQGTEAALARKRAGVHDFIAKLAARLGHPGGAPRAQLLLDQTMAKGGFQWGRTAQLLAAGCVIIALREANKPVVIHEVALSVNEPDVALTRALVTVLNTLKLRLHAADAREALAILPAYLTSLARDAKSNSQRTGPPLPGNLASLINSLQMTTVLRTAQALMDLVSVGMPSTPTDNVQTSPPSSVRACALFTLALEGESLRALPNLGAFAQLVSARFGVSKDSITRYYKSVSDYLHSLLLHVPWLRPPTDNKNYKAKDTSVARRNAVARGLKDLLHFQIQGTDSEGLGDEGASDEDNTHVGNDHAETGSARASLSLPLSLSSAAAQTDVGSEASTRSSSRYDASAVTPKSPSDVGKGGQHIGNPDTRNEKSKKGKRSSRPFTQASSFLLSLGAPCAEGASRKRRKAGDNGNGNNENDPGAPDILQMASHFLSTDAVDAQTAPTWVQLLASSTAGGVDEIDDDALFAEGELEGFIRSEEEVRVLRGVCEWANVDASDEEEEGGHKEEGSLVGENGEVRGDAKDGFENGRVDDMGAGYDVLAECGYDVLGDVDVDVPHDDCEESQYGGNNGDQGDIGLEPYAQTAHPQPHEQARKKRKTQTHAPSLAQGQQATKATNATKSKSTHASKSDGSAKGKGTPKVKVKAKRGAARIDMDALTRLLSDTDGNANANIG